MLDKINKLIAEISGFSVLSPDDLELFRLKFLSKKGYISELFDDFRNVASDEKKELGQKLNQLKQQAQERYNYLKDSLIQTQKTSRINDITRPA